LIEAGLQRFGFDAKRYALYIAILATLATLTALGTVVLGRGWPGYAVLMFGIGLWLFVMLIVMPLTSAGWFATELLDGAWSAVMGYLAVSLVYAGLLQLARIALHMVGAASSAGALSAMRRTALIGIGSAFAALIGTYLVRFVEVRDDPAAFRRLDPKEPAPPGGIDPHATPPDSVVAQPDTATASPEQPTSNAQFTRESTLPEPRAARPMKRDKDGA